MDGNESVKETVRRVFSEYLNARQLRKTEGRFAILDAIYSIDGQFDTTYLYSQMEDNIKFRVSQATLYNTLSLLIDAKLVVKHQFGKRSCYEKNYNEKIRHQMVCLQCGKVREFDDPSLQAIIEKTKLRRFTLNHYSLYFYGLCSSCKLANKRKTINNNHKKGK